MTWSLDHRRDRLSERHARGRTTRACAATGTRCGTDGMETVMEDAFKGFEVHPAGQ